MGFGSWLHYFTDVAQRRSTTLHDVWQSPGLVRYMYIFGGSCPQTEYYHVQNSLSVQVLHSYPIFAALLQGTRVVGVSPTLWYSAESATYIWQGGHHVEHRPTFQFCSFAATKVLCSFASGLKTILCVILQQSEMILSCWSWHYLWRFACSVSFCDNFCILSSDTASSENVSRLTTETTGKVQN